MAILRCASCGAKVKSEEGKFTATCEYCGNEMTVFESTAEFEIDSKGKLVQYNGKGGDVVVPDDVRIIGHHCFFKNERIFSVKLPESIVEIQERAFEGCSELENINLPNSLEALADHVFFGCSSLKEIIVPDGILSLKKSVFCKCSSLKKVSLPDSIRNFEAYVFDECNKLEAIKLPKNLRVIGDYSFDGCTSLKTIEFGNKIETIGDRAFYECSSIESVTIPDSVEQIGQWAFSSCKNLRNLILQNGLKSISNYAFSKCPLNEELVIPDSVVEIHEGAFGIGFDKNTNVHSVICGSGVKTISFCNAFSNLEKIRIGSNVEQIDDRLFYNSHIKQIHLPNSISRIGNAAFMGCKDLVTVSLKSKSESKLNEIDRSAFNGCSALKSIQFPDNLKLIGQSAFEDCTSLSKAVLPQNLQTLGECAFQNTALEIVVIPSSLKRIPNSAFVWCDHLTKVFIKEGCEEIGENAFSNPDFNASHVEAYLPSTIKSIGDEAFHSWKPFFVYSAENSVIKAYCYKEDSVSWNLISDSNQRLLQSPLQEKNEEFKDAVNTMSSAHTETEYKSVAQRFKELSGFENSDALAEKCLEKAELLHKEAIYKEACDLLKSQTKKNIEDGISALKSLDDFKDSRELVVKYSENIDQIINDNIYESAVNSLKTNTIEGTKDSIEKLSSIPGWKDADSLLNKSKEQLQSLIDAENQKIAKQKAEEKAKATKRLIKKIVLTILLVAIIAIFVMITINVITNILNKPKEKYDTACQYIESGNFKEAADLLYGFNYEDSEALLQKLVNENASLKLYTANIGDSIGFGKFEQDNKSRNGAEEISWNIIAIEDKKILLQSTYVLYAMPLHNDNHVKPWEKCDLYNWLNNDFYGSSFTDSEKGMITDTKYGKVFILDADDYKKYFSDEHGHLNGEELSAPPTKFAKKIDGLKISKSGNAEVWIRRNTTAESIGIVCDQNRLKFYDNKWTEYVCGVRPVMWINIAPIE